MTWLQLRLLGDRAEAASLEDLLLDTGAVAVTLEDSADEPVLEPAPGETPLWNHIRLTGLYQADTNMDEVLAALPEQVRSHSDPKVEILEDKDWEREWIQHYQPMQFGERLWICPSWLEPPQPNAINLLLDPGLAFGTGTHPTTALCLTQLDGMDLADKRLVDYGCGSGILALAALKLGAAAVLGVDNDPQALTASRDNAQRNAVESEHLPVALPDDARIARWQGSAAVVVANILAGPLIDLADTLLQLLQPGGTLLLSGLLDTQAQEICAAYAPRIALAVAGEKDGWVCLRGELAT